MFIGLDWFNLVTLANSTNVISWKETSFNQCNHLTQKWTNPIQSSLKRFGLDCQFLKNKIVEEFKYSPLFVLISTIKIHILTKQSSYQKHKFKLIPIINKYKIHIKIIYKLNFTFIHISHHSSKSIFHLITYRTLYLISLQKFQIFNTEQLPLT